MAAIASGSRRSGIRKAMPLLLPAYLWLVVAIFLPLSAMVFFSFMTDLPLTGKDWSFTLANYKAFLQTGIYGTLLLSSLRLGLEVTFWCLVLGFPAAYVLAKVLKGRSREAIFLLVILPFWSNGLVRIFSWAMVLREGGILDTALNAILPFRINIDIMYSYPAVIIGLVHSYVPYVVLTCYLSLQAIDNSIIEAARSLGASRLTVLRRLILPPLPLIPRQPPLRPAPMLNPAPWKKRTFANPGICRPAMSPLTPTTSPRA